MFSARYETMLSSIRENAVIGNVGFGSERDTKGTLIRRPHLSGVRSGRNVEIEVFTAVCAVLSIPPLLRMMLRSTIWLHRTQLCCGKGCAYNRMCGVD